MLVVAELLVTYTYRHSYLDTYRHRPAVFWLWQVPFKLAILGPTPGSGWRGGGAPTSPGWSPGWRCVTLRLLGISGEHRRPRRPPLGLLTAETLSRSAAIQANQRLPRSPRRSAPSSDHADTLVRL